MGMPLARPVRLSVLLLSVAFLAAGLSGCFARGNVDFPVEDPRPDAWTPASMLIGAVQAAGGDPERTRVLEYGATFDEDGILRILDLRVWSHDADGDGTFYLDYLVAQDYEADEDRVLLRGFKHEELTLGQRPDPAKEFDLNASLLETLDRATFAQMAQPQVDELGDVPVVLEFRVRADCVPSLAEDGTWRVHNVTETDLEAVPGNHSLTCHTRPTLPPTIQANIHTPCYRGPACPEGQIHPILLVHPTNVREP